MSKLAGRQIKFSPKFLLLK